MVIQELRILTGLSWDPLVINGSLYVGGKKGAAQY